MGFALVDTGAQRGVCGQKQFQGLVKYLGEAFGLKPIQTPTLEMDAMGVGGSTKILSSWTMPIGIAKNCGTLAVHVIAVDVPLLLPFDMLRQLGRFLTCLMDVSLENWRQSVGNL